MFSSRQLNLFFSTVFFQVLFCGAVENIEAEDSSAASSASSTHSVLAADSGAKVKPSLSKSQEAGKYNKSAKVDSVSDSDEKVDADSEFQPLSAPYKNMTGAYLGAGLNFSHLSYNVGLFEKHDDKKPEKKVSANAFQPAIALVGGFGTAFYRDWYAGLEFEFFDRFSKRSKKKDDMEVIFKSTLGFGMDARLGYQFPKNGLMVYGSIGFSRVLGAMGFKEKDTKGEEKKVKRSFGSFFPTIGAGVMYKMNQSWMLQANVHYTIGSKEKKKFISPRDMETYKKNLEDIEKDKEANKDKDPMEGITQKAMQGKPRRWGFGIYLLRQI